MKRSRQAAMADLGATRDQLANVKVASTLQNDVSAQTATYSDGSALVRIADGILSLCEAYSTFAAIGLHQAISPKSLGDLWRIARVVRRGRLGGDPSVLTGLLRYYNVHQRIFGISGNLGLRIPERAQATRFSIFIFSLRFVIAHELAHHVLQHDSPVSAFSPDEHIPPCSDNQNSEFDADILAFRACARMGETELGSASKEISVVHLLGALIAMLVLYSTERSLLVRAGHSHPAATHRAARLLGRQSHEYSNSPRSSSPRSCQRPTHQIHLRRPLPHSTGHGPQQRPKYRPRIRTNICAKYPIWMSLSVRCLRILSPT